MFAIRSPEKKGKSIRDKLKIKERLSSKESTFLREQINFSGFVVYNIQKLRMKTGFVIGLKTMDSFFEFKSLLVDFGNAGNMIVHKLFGVPDFLVHIFDDFVKLMIVHSS